ncbi:hypothetical protein F2A38_19565 [Pseudomonas chlororaphis]|uniref:Uncharacterized protein n=1 Tax=Pseudomonas chlororaphis TaxID=587753 RepID=A0AB34C2G7_9PSED|nr:hypothetical protein [Pseudomonas chlororaphis]KAA5840229.1 hypothetical protein F2A38_19565 [Pseudomonas chlororaphis]
MPTENKIKRYTVAGLVQSSENPTMQFVTVVDFDRVTAERDEALEISESRFSEIIQNRDCINQRGMRVHELQQRLTAADERADVLEGLLHKWLSQFSKPGVTGGPITTLKEETAKALSAKESESHA